MAGPPLWRKAFDRLERPVGDALAAGARSDAFTDTLAVALRLRRRLQREVERRTRRSLHLVNLPAATDVRRLSEQIAALQRQVRQLERELDSRDGGRPAARTTTKRTRS
jgi:hypothetical protein